MSVSGRGDGAGGNCGSEGLRGSYLPIGPSPRKLAPSSIHISGSRANWCTRGRSFASRSMQGISPRPCGRGLREALHSGDAILFELLPRSACQRSPIALLQWGFFDRLGSLKLDFRELFSARIVGNLMDINENGSVMSFRRIDDREAKVSASAVQDGESRFLQ